MELQEQLKILEDLEMKAVYKGDHDTAEALSKAIASVKGDSALYKKQTKMKPIYKLTDEGDAPDAYEGYCPVCGSNEPLYGDNYCPNCGQAIDWGEDMSLDDAITHLNELLRRRDAEWDCYECKQQHRQLRDWLEELKDRREKGE